MGTIYQLPEIPEAPPMPNKPETNPVLPETQPMPVQPVTIPGIQPVPEEQPTRIPPKEVVNYVRMILNYGEYSQNYLQL